MTKFNVGEMVVALNSNDSKYNSREAGKKYKVLGVMKCVKCEEEMVCINPNNLPKTFAIRCGECGCTDMHSTHPWIMAKNFALADNLEERLKVALATEDYELAAELRDRLNATK